MRAEMTTGRGIKKAQEVEPVKSLKDIQRIKQYLLGRQDNTRKSYRHTANSFILSTTITNVIH